MIILTWLHVIHWFLSYLVLSHHCPRLCPRVSEDAAPSCKVWSQWRHLADWILSSAGSRNFALSFNNPSLSASIKNIPPTAEIKLYNILTRERTTNLVSKCISNLMALLFEFLARYRQYFNIINIVLIWSTTILAPRPAGCGRQSCGTEGYWKPLSRWYLFTTLYAHVISALSRALNER